MPIWNLRPWTGATHPLGMPGSASGRMGMGHPMPTQLSDVHSQISTDSPRSAFTIRFQGSGSLLTLTVTPGRILFRARAIV